MLHCKSNFPRLRTIISCNQARYEMRQLLLVTLVQNILLFYCCSLLSLQTIDVMNLYIGLRRHDVIAIVTSLFWTSVPLCAHRLVKIRVHLERCARGLSKMYWTYRKLSFFSYFTHCYVLFFKGCQCVLSVGIRV